MDEFFDNNLGISAILNIFALFLLIWLMTTKIFILVIMFVWGVCIIVFTRITSTKERYVMAFMCIVTYF